MSDHQAEITSLTLGDLDTNCYILGCPITNQAIIIDPADEGEFITTQLLERHLTPKYIVLTHGHFDHVLGLLELKLNFGVPILMHPADDFLLARAQKSAEHFLKRKVDPVPMADQPLRDGQVIEFGQQSITVMSTPGHTPGSVTFVTDHFIFSGDTLFRDGSFGSADHHYSDRNKLRTSIEKIKKLTDRRVLLAGHS